MGGGWSSGSRRQSWLGGPTLHRRPCDGCSASNRRTRRQARSLRWRMRSTLTWCRRHVRRRADLLEHGASGLELGSVPQGSAVVLRIGSGALGLPQAVDDEDRRATEVVGGSLADAEQQGVKAPALEAAEKLV